MPAPLFWGAQFSGQGMASIRLGKEAIKAGMAIARLSKPSFLPANKPSSATFVRIRSLASSSVLAMAQDSAPRLSQALRSRRQSASYKLTNSLKTEHFAVLHKERP